MVDEGAARALGAGASLLPAGVTAVVGEFARGDCLRILDAQGNELGRGLSAFDSAKALLLLGRNSRDIEGLTGSSGRAAMIHRDDMALRAE